MFDVTAKYDWTLKPSEGSLMGSEISLVEAVIKGHFNHLNLNNDIVNTPIR